MTTMFGAARTPRCLFFVDLGANPDPRNLSVDTCADGALFRAEPPNSLPSSCVRNELLLGEELE